MPVVTPIGPYTASEWVLVTRKTNHMIRTLRLLASPTSREERGIEMEFSPIINDLTDHAYKTEHPPPKISGHQNSKELLDWWTHQCVGRVIFPDSRERIWRVKIPIPIPMCVGAPHTKQFLDTSWCPTAQFNSDTIYLEIASDPRG